MPRPRSSSQWRNRSVSSSMSRSPSAPTPTRSGSPGPRPTPPLSGASACRRSPSRPPARKPSRSWPRSSPEPCRSRKPPRTTPRTATPPRAATWAPATVWELKGELKNEADLDAVLAAPQGRAFPGLRDHGRYPGRSTGSRKPPPNPTSPRPTCSSPSPTTLTATRRAGSRTSPWPPRRPSRPPPRRFRFGRGLGRLHRQGNQALPAQLRQGPRRRLLLAAWRSRHHRPARAQGRRQRRTLPAGGVLPEGRRGLRA